MGLHGARAVQQKCHCATDDGLVFFTAKYGVFLWVADQTRKTTAIEQTLVLAKRPAKPLRVADALMDDPCELCNV